MLVHLGLGALDQGEDVAHAEDARGHPLRLEGLQLGDLLPHSGEEDGLAHRLLHGESRAAPGVPIQLGQDDAVHADLLVEFPGDVDGLLAGHRVDHQHGVVDRDLLADLLELREHRLVNLEAPGGVEDDDVAIEPPCLLQPALAEIGGLALAVGHGDRDLVVLAQLLQLLGRRRTLGVGRHEERAMSVPPGGERELGAGGGLAAALEADEHHHGGRLRLVAQLALLPAQQRHQLLVDDLHDLLAGSERLEHVGTDGALADAVDQGTGDLEVDVRLEEGETHLAHPQLDLLLGQAAAPGERLEDLTEAVGEGFEHGQPSSPRRARSPASTASRRDSSAAWPSLASKCSSWARPRRTRSWAPLRLQPRLSASSAKDQSSSRCSRQASRW